MDQQVSGNTDPSANPINVAVGAATTALDVYAFADWSVFTGSMYWAVAFGHDAGSTAAGAFKIQLRDDTNNTTLYTFSSASSGAVGNTQATFSTAEATHVIIVKPSGQAKLHCYFIDGDTTARSMFLWQSWLVLY